MVYVSSQKVLSRDASDPHTTGAGGSWRCFSGQNDPFSPKSPLSAFIAISGEMAVYIRARMHQDSVSTTCPCHSTPRLRRAPRRYDLRKRPLRPQLRLCLAAKPALRRGPLLTIRRPARSAQTAQARPASLNNQVTAMRGRQSSLAPRMRRQHWRPFAPPPRPTVAAPGRCCGPVRGAAWPRLITTLAAGRSLDMLDVIAQLRDCSIR